MKKEDAEELTQSVGQSVSGAWRTIARLQKMGVPKALGLTTEEWVQKRLGGYVKIAAAERYDAAVELKAKGHSTRQIGAALGVDEKTIRRDKRGGAANAARAGKKGQGKKAVAAAKAAPAPLDAVAGLVADEAMHKAAEKEQAKEEAAAQTKARREASQNAGPRPDGFTLRIGDAREVLADVQPDSVHLILTDPPYGDEAAPLYEWLAEWSARVLVPGGSLICFTGQSRHDRDMRIFANHLRWWWLLAKPHTQVQRIPGKFVMAEFKPVLWLVKDHRRGRTLVNDWLRADHREKVVHAWGQGNAGVDMLIQQLTDPDELIVDPFAGTGRWGEIAARMGRVWLGADVVAGGDTVAVVTETKEAV